jgi:hypothetical protein
VTPDQNGVDSRNEPEDEKGQGDEGGFHLSAPTLGDSKSCYEHEERYGHEQQNQGCLGWFAHSLPSRTASE